MSESACRICGLRLRRSFLDLGVSPLANALLREEELDSPESFFPLHAYVCEGCLLVQVEPVRSPQEIFSEYAYFSSYSDTSLRFARDFADAAIARHGLGAGSRVIEIASNDGYLLRHFAARGIPVLGIEPAANVAAEAERVGVPTRVAFFGEALARQLLEEGLRPDLVVANNVLAHVPDLGDFVSGLRLLAGARGVISLEFPHLLHLVEQVQFDTIYHEHLSYFSLATARRCLQEQGLEVFAVEALPTHGGSLRLSVQPAGGPRPRSPEVERWLRREREAGLEDLETYDAFSRRALRVKLELLRFLVEAREKDEAVVGYGAAAKGNTLLNYCGITRDLVEFVVDRSPHKQGRFLPGTHIPVRAPRALEAARPRYVLVLPWNLLDEVVEQMQSVRSWGGAFVVPIPRLEVLP